MIRDVSEVLWCESTLRKILVYLDKKKSTWKNSDICLTLWLSWGYRSKFSVKFSSTSELNFVAKLDSTWKSIMLTKITSFKSATPCKQPWRGVAFVLCPNYVSHLILIFRVKWKKGSFWRKTWSRQGKLKQYIKTPAVNDLISKEKNR